MGHIESGEGRNMPCCCCCCCCWRRVIATFEAAAAVCKGACTNGAQINGRGCEEDIPPGTVPPAPPIQLPVVTSCIAGMLSCLTICCTKMLSQDPAAPRPLLAPPSVPSPPPGPGPGPGPPPRPRVLLVTEPP